MDKELYEMVSRLQDNHWWFIARKNFVREALKRDASFTGKRLLDIGSGMGSMIEFLKGYAEKVTGIDYSEYALRLSADRGYDALVRGTVEDLPFSDGSFDLATSFEVLYHKQVGDDNKVLRELYRVLRKGGMVVIVDSAFNFLKGKHDDFAHGVRRYTRGELESKLEGAGFTVRRSSYLYMSIFPVLCVIRLIKNIFLPKASTSSELHETQPWLNNLMISLLRVESSILRRANLPFGISVFCIAEKE